jgi:hypothetical protein
MGRCDTAAVLTFRLGHQEEEDTGPDEGTDLGDEFEGHFGWVLVVVLDGLLLRYMTCNCAKQRWLVGRGFCVLFFDF